MNRDKRKPDKKKQKRLNKYPEFQRRNVYCNYRDK